MSNPSDFVIENGVLKKYVGLGGDVVVPEGVTSIGNSAFSGCSSLTSIILPEGVTSIGEYAFYRCSSLTNITLPEGVTSIGSWAFSDCSSLMSITLPEGLTSIGEYAFDGCSSLTGVTIPESVTCIRGSAFEGCKGLADADGFIIVRNDYVGIVLNDYVGPGGDVVIPEYVTCVDENAFYAHYEITSITLPPHVEKISHQAFFACGNMKKILLSDDLEELGEDVFSECRSLELVKSPIMLGYQSAPKCCFALQMKTGHPEYLAYSSKQKGDNLTDYAHPGKWNLYDLELINNGPKYKYSMNVRLVGALGRLLNPVELSAESRTIYVEWLNKQAKKLVAFAENLEEAGIIQALFDTNVLDEKTNKAVRKLLSASSVSSIADLASYKSEVQPPKLSPPVPKTAYEPEDYYEKRFQELHGDRVLRNMALVGVSIPSLQFKDGTPAPESLFRFLLASYGTQTTGPFHFIPEADEAAALLSSETLSEALDHVSGHLDGMAHPSLLPLICRYGTAKQIHTLTRASQNWSAFGSVGRKNQQLLQDAMVLSDTREAIIWLEKKHSIEPYAKVRGLTAKEVYERTLFNFGFDQAGKRMFDLGSTCIELSLGADLSLVMWNTKTQKPVKTIPKKGVDPETQSLVANEIADIRQNLKKAVKVKNGQLFAAFLNAETISAEQWKQSYLHNPFLKKLAELVVWEQDGKTFALTDIGFIYSDEKPYSFSDKPVKVAHPMEMQEADTTAWQKYFTTHGLKQPFQQVWEPVRKPEEIDKNRYGGCMIPFYRFSGQEKHGIIVKDFDSHDIIIIEFKDCYSRVERIDIKPYQIRMDDRFQILKFGLKRQTRQANHIVAYLDRVTVWERVRRDELSVMDLMPGFTLAQITEFIAAAQEANATNVLAALLEYKNANFTDFDPMDKFTLEW